MVTDPISDMLTQMRNALMLKKAEVVLPYSKLKHNLAKLLENQGWLERAAVDEHDDRKILRLVMRYESTGTAAISGLKRVSKPGQRIYARYFELPRYSNQIGATIVSTSRGLMTDREAKKAKIGGEIICQIW